MPRQVSRQVVHRKHIELIRKPAHDIRRRAVRLPREAEPSGEAVTNYCIFSQLQLPPLQPALYPWLNSTGQPLPPPHPTLPPPQY